MTTVRTLIVDDEPLGRQRLRTLLKEDPDVALVGECEDGAQALAALKAAPCDLVFLDVQMPGLDGVELVRAVGPERMPAVVFVTAHDRYAVHAFELRAVDYLLKPFDRARFERSLVWAKDHVGRARLAEADDPFAPPAGEGKARARPSQYVTVREPGRFYLLKAEDVDWVEAAGNYLRLHVGRDTHLLRETMNSLERRLDPARFVRIHRSAIVNVERVREFQALFHGEYAVILRDGTELTLSRNYRSGLSAFLGDAL
jgi:two-component system LytT family response regulator